MQKILVESCDNCPYVTVTNYTNSYICNLEEPNEDGCYKILNEYIKQKLTPSWCKLKDDTSKNTYITLHPIVGNCVRANNSFRKDEIIEVNNVIPVEYSSIENSSLKDYSMSWTNDLDCISLGNIQLLNHSENPNCYILNIIDSKTKMLCAKRDIKKDEHLTINYDRPLGFDPIEVE